MCVCVCILYLYYNHYRAEKIAHNSRCAIAENVPKCDSTSFLVSFVFSSQNYLQKATQLAGTQNPLSKWINYINTFYSVSIHPLNC